MDKSQQIAPTEDIAQEPYRGPSAVVTALGQGAIDHLTWGIMGLAGGAVAARLFHKPIKGLLDDLRVHFADAAAHSNILVQSYGKTFRALIGRGKLSEQTHHAFGQFPPCDGEDLVHWVNERENGFGMWMLNHTVGLFKPAKKGIAARLEKYEWATPTITAGGTLGAIGYIGGWLNAAFYGGDRAHDGRNQFERAQQEITDQRTINSALSEKYIETKQQLEDLKTTKAAEQGTLHVAPDNPPVVHHHPKSPDVIPPPDAIKVREPIAPKHGKEGSGWKDAIADQRAHATEQTELA